MVICFTEVRFLQTLSPLRWSQRRVSFNPFLLLNGQLDRVSFLLNQTGHLDPLQGPPQLGVSCFDYKCLENKNVKKKAIQEQELKEHEQNSLSLVTKCLGWIWDLERL
jgi:hypothetical protein